MRPGALIPTLLLVSSIAAAQQLGPEIPISAPGPLLPTTAHIPRVASNGSGFLAVWHDNRANGDIYAARMDPQGKLLDPTGILVKSRSGAASVASDGHDYLVAISEGCTDISVIRVDASGGVGAPKHIGANSHLCSNTEIVSNGDSYLVTWLPGNAALLDRDGNIIAGPFNLAPLASFFRVAVASNGRDYVVAASVQNSVTPIVIVPVSRRGEVGSVQTLFPSHASDVAIASDGNGYVVAVTEQNAVRVLRLGPDGVPIAPEADEIGPGVMFTPRVAWNGSHYVIGYVDSRLSGTSLRFIELDPTTGTLRPGAFVSDVVPGDPGHDLVSSNGELLVAWTQDNETSASILSEAAMRSGQELVGTPLGRAPSSQSGPMLITDGVETVAFWREGDRLHAVAMSADGRPLSHPVEIAQGYGLDFHAAFTGSTVIATWRTNDQLYARRYTPTLQPIDANAVLIAKAVTPFQRYALAASNNAALLVWSAPSRMTGAYDDDLQGAIVGTVGAMTTTPVTFAQLVFEDGVVSAAWNGSEFLVAWAHALGPPPLQGIYPFPPNAILAVRVSTAGQVLDLTPTTISGLGAATATASNGRNFLVAWTDGKAIYEEVVGADGSVSSPPTQIAPTPSNGSTMTLVSDGDGYIVFWTLSANADAYTIHFRPVDAEGRPGAFTSLPQTARAYSGGAASLARTATGLVVIYDRLADEAEFAGVSRVFTRTVVPSAGRRRVISTF